MTEKIIITCKDKVTGENICPQVPYRNGKESILELETPETILTVTDGYHTFDELYKHRITLFITLCSVFRKLNWAEYDGHNNIRMSKKHDDGSEYKGWFIMGLNSLEGKQISYHLPIEYWDKCKEFAIPQDKAPNWDGHTSDDVLERLLKI